MLRYILVMLLGSLGETLLKLAICIAGQGRFEVELEGRR
jgi:hypothetical protein